MATNQYATHWKEAVPALPGMRLKLRTTLRNLKLSFSSIVNKRESSTFLRGIYCHYVFDDQKKDFENLIVDLKNTGKFITTDQCIQMLRGDLPIDGKFYHLSFDDGFKNNFTNAYPILKEHKVPAIFFVPSSLVGADWNTAKDYCMNATCYRKVIELMSWEDLKVLLSEGYEIGSHTKTHTRFSDISRYPELMKNEILGSKIELENNLDFTCKYIAWPFGKLTDADLTSLDMVQKAGYEACFGAFRGSISPKKTNIFSIPRHHFEPQWPISHIKYFARGNMELK